MHSHLFAFLFSAFAMVSILSASDRPRIDAFTGKNTEVEFEAVVVERLRSDGIWCGNIATYQGIRYRVTRGLRGDPGGVEVIVYHGLVGPPLCDEDASLSRSIFRVGNRVRLVVEKTPSGVLVGWEDPADVTILEMSNKAAEPGATDNPDDAQRLREDH